MRDSWFESLVDWNFWGNLKVELKEREVVPKLPRKDIILSIIGVRRVGKTYLSYLIMKNFKPQETLLINFEDPRLANVKAEDIIKLVEMYRSRVCLDGPRLIVMDEIQNINNWEKVARFYAEAKGINVIVTGSSSKLLSGELASVLTGRHNDFELYPLSLREILMWKGLHLDNISIYKNKAQIMREFERYIKYGGFPEINLIDDDMSKKNMLRHYFEDILTKDIILRFKIREINKLKDLAKIYLSNIATLQSYNRIKSSINLSLDSVERFSKYLENVRLFFFVPKFSYSLRQQILNPRKVYIIDLGFYTAIGFRFSENIGRIMENAVAIELFRRKAYWHPDWEIYYWRDYSQREVDFVIKSGTKVINLIQVTYSSSRDEIENREIRNLMKAAEDTKANKLTVITWDYDSYEKINGKILQFIPLWKFLLGMDQA